MYLEFPFEYARIKGIGRLFYPVAVVQLKTVVGWKDFEFLVDTGADMTTIPSRFLEALGLVKGNLKESKSWGVGNISVKTWDFKVPMRIGDTELMVQASAVDAEKDSTALLLGRKDIFEDKFSLVVDSKRKVTIFRKN